MKKYGVVDGRTATCALCDKHATSYPRGEPRCDEHAGTDDLRTKSVKVAEDHVAQGRQPEEAEGGEA